MGAAELFRDCSERLSQRPDDPEVITLLESLVGSEVSLQAAQLLAKTLEGTDRHDKLIAALDVVATAAREPSEKIAALTRIAEVYRQGLRQPDLALAALAKALELDPGDGGLHAKAEEVAREADAVDVLIELLSDLVERSAAPAQVALRKTLAVLHKRSNSDHRVATEHLRAALSVAPNDLEILSVLRRDHEQREEWAALADITERLARAHPERSEQLGLWRAAARLHDSRLQDDQSALECWLHVLEIYPDDGEAKQASAALAKAVPPLDPAQQLAGLLNSFRGHAERVTLLPTLKELAQKAQALEAVADAVELESERVEDPVEVAALLRFVAQTREELGQDKRALTLWNDLLAVAPDDGEALEHLARLLGKTGDVTHAAEISLRRGRATALGTERHLRFVEAAHFFVAAAKPDAALSALDESLARQRPVEDATSLAPLHLLRGQLLEHAGNPQAVEAYSQALLAGEHQTRAVAGIERLLKVPAARVAAGQAIEASLRRLDEPARLAAALEAQVETGSPREQALARLTEAATLWEKAQQPRGAFTAYLRAVVLAPTALSLRAEAERLARTVSAYDELLATYEALLKQHPEGLDAALPKRVAELHEALGHPGEALEAWEQAVAAAGEDAALLQAFAEKARARGDFVRLAKALRLQVAKAAVSAERSKLLWELANLCEDTLADASGAAVAYQQLLDEAPGDAGLLKKLLRLYGQTQNVPGLVQVLGQLLVQAQQAGSNEATALALRLAQLKVDASLDDAGALALLREVLKNESGNAQAVAALARLASSPGPVQHEAAQLATSALERLGDHSLVVQILEAQLPAQTGARERAAILSQIADLQAGPLHEPELAFLAIVRALRENPLDATVLARCGALAAAAQAGEELEALLESLAAEQPAGTGRAALYRALARQLDGHGAVEEAISAWKQVFEQLPADDEAGQRLEALYESTQRFNELAALAQARVDASTVTGRPAALLQLAGALEHVGRLEDAASTLRNVFALTRGTDALVALEQLLERLGQPLERAEVLKRLAAQSPDESSRMQRLLQEGRALLAAKEPERAVAVFGEMLGRAPDEPRAVSELVTLLATAALRPQIATLLKPVFKSEGQGWQRVAVLEALVEMGELEGAQALREELAALYERLGAFTQAFAGRLRLVSVAPDDAAGRTELERLASVAHLEEELVAAYEDLLERTQVPAVALPLRRTIARLYSGPLARPEAAIRAWEELAALDAQSLEAFAALAGLYRQSGAFKELSRVLVAQSALLPNVDEKLLPLREAAEVAETKLNDAALAASAWQQVVALAPQDAAAAHALEQNLAKLGRHGEAAEVLTAQIKLAKAQHRADDVLALTLRLGALSVNELGRYEEALGLFREALELHWPDAEAVAGLETLLVRAQPLRPFVAEVLERVYRDPPQPRRLAEALELQLAVAAPPRALAILEELGVLRESLGDLALALVARQEIYSRAPGEARSRAELERLAAATGQLEELVELYRQRLAVQSVDAGETLALWRKLADIFLQQGQRTEATQALEEVARRAGDELAPLVALQDLYRADQAYAPLASVLRRRVALESDAERQVELWLELAVLAETRLGDSAAAVDACREVLAKNGTHTVALDMLERLLESGARFAELSELLGQRVAAAPAKSAEALDLTVRWARVQHRSLKEDDFALELLKVVLATEEAHSRAVAALEEMMGSNRAVAEKAAAALEGHYQRVNEPTQAIAALEVRVGWALDAAKKPLLHRIAELHENALNAPAQAFSTLARLLPLMPDDVDTRERLRALAPVAKAEAAWVALLAQVLPSAREKETKLAMLRLVAEGREQLGDAGAALSAWQELLVLSADDAQALLAASALLEAASRWNELLELYQRRLALAADDEARAMLLARIAETHLERMADPQGAYDAFRSLLSLRPADCATLARLEGVCAQLGRWAEVAQMLGRRLRLEEGDRTDLLLRLAQVRREHLNDGEGALPLLNEVLVSQPQHPLAVAELTRLVEARPGWEPAEDLLLGAYRQSRDAARLGVLLDACANRGGTVARRRALWLELAELRLAKTEDAELAFLALARAFRESPDDAALRERLVTLAHPADSYEALAALFEEVLPALASTVQADTRLALAALCEGPLNEPERAVTLYREALAQGPAVSARALAALDRVLQSLGRWEALLEVLEQRAAAAADSEERIALLLRMGVIASERLQRDERSAEAYRAVLEQAADHLEAARALERLYEKSSNLERLKAMLELLLRLESGAALQAVRLKLAHLSAPDGGERTVALCRELLAEDPLHHQGFEILAKIYEERERYVELDELFRTRLGVTLSPEAAGELAYRLGELHYRRRNDLGAAANWYRTVLGHLSRHLGALLALAEIAEASGDKRELKDVLAQLALVQEEPALRLGHHLRRAEVLSELGEASAAVAAARQALELRPTALSQAHRLRALLLKEKALPEVAQALALTAELEVASGHTADAVAAWFELQAIEQQRGNQTGAAVALEQALTHAPSHRQAFDAAKALYEKTQQWPAWAAVVSKFTVHLKGAEQLAALDELAQVHQGQLGDDAGAFSWAKQALALDPGSKPRREQVEKLGRALRKLDEVAGFYAELIEKVPFGPAYTQIALALARLQDEQLNQVERAEATLVAVLAFDPEHAGALDALAQMFSRRGLHEKRAGALELKLEAAGTVEERGKLLAELATLHEEKLKNPKAASQALRRLLDVQPTAANARGLVALHRRHQQWPAALEALLEARGLASTPSERVSLQLDIAQLHEEQLRAPDAAVADYLHALELEPASSQAFRALERLYTGLHRPVELLRAYEQRLAQTQAHAERAELFFKSGELWKARSNSAQADRCYEAVLALEPHHVPSLEALAQVRRAEKQWEPLSQVLSRHLETKPEATVLAALCFELGEIAATQLRDPKAARRAWTQAVDAVHDHRAALQALCALDQQEGRWAEAVLLLNAQAQLETKHDERTALYFQAGVLCEERLKDPTGAATAWKRALESDAVHLPSLRRLRDIFLNTANWPEYEQNLAVEAKRSPISESRCAAAIELAKHYENRVRDASQATAWYQHAFTARPDALEAGLPLSSLLSASKQWPAAATVLQATVELLEKAGPGQKRELSLRLSHWAFALRQLRRPQDALAAYERALQVDAADVMAMRGQLEVLEELGQKSEAAAKLESFLSAHARSLEAAVQVELYLRLGQWQLGLGAAEAALVSGEHALENDVVHVGALRLLVAASDQVPVYEKAVVYRQRLAAVASDVERYRLAFDAAVLAEEKLSSPTRAIDGYLMALKWKANAKEALQRLHVAYRAAGHNRKAADTLKSLLAHPELSHGDWKRETLALADLTARAMGETERAVDVLEAALDKDAAFIEALQVIEALLSKNKQWENLDGCYQRMIRRLGAGDDTAVARAALHRAVGELRLHRIKNRESALAALEEGARLTPDDALAQEAFAELALEFPERERDGLAAYLRVLRVTASPAKACRAVAEVAQRHREVDTHFIATRALATITTLADVEPMEPPAFRAPLSDLAWRKWLLHPQAAAFGELMALIYEQAGHKYGVDLGDLKLHPSKHAVDLAVTTHPAIEALTHIARELGFAAPPRLYSPFLAVQTSSKRVSHHDDNASLRVLPTFPLSFVVGERFFSDMNAGVRAGLIARGLSHLRPELAISALVTPEQLALIFEAALSLGDPSYVSRADTKTLKNERKRLEKALSSNARAALTNVVEKLRRRTGSADFAHYLDAVGHTAVRTALLVTGDFAPVRARLIPEGPAAEPMIRELLLFALGGGLHALRVETGTAIRQ